MKNVLVFVAGCMIIAPALLTILSGELLPTLFGILYIVSINIFIPRSFWKRFWKVNMMINKAFEL